MHFDLLQNTILLCRAGSRSYGMQHPRSDWDYKGIAVAPLEHRISLHKTFEQCDDIDKIFPPICRIDVARESHNWKRNVKAEGVVFDVAKAMKLLGQGNPNMIEILFVEPEDRIFASVHGGRLIAARDMFISLACKHRYAGYAHSQLQKMRHRSVESVRRDTVEEFGYDTKHAAHLIRLARTGVEILETGKVNVRRADADELLAIRQGKLLISEIEREAEHLLARMDSLYATNPCGLPHSPDWEKINDLATSIMMTFEEHQ